MIVEGTPGSRMSCPACGFSAVVPAAKAPAAPPPAPSPAPAVPYSPTPPAEAPPSFAPPPTTAPMPTAPPGTFGSGHGPLGKRRSPWTPVLLPFVTLGIYSLVWYWKTSKEVDAFMMQPGHAHGRVRIGVFLYAIALPLLLIGAVILIITLGANSLDQPGAEPTADEITAIITAAGVFVVAAIMILIGMIFIIIGMWRVWKMMEQDDHRRMVSQPFSATLPLVLMLLGFIPYVGFILYAASLYVTQAGLNKVWAAYGAPGAQM